ncbi:MAG: hypothetical protein WC661_07625 [Opitutaceae bacterium]|jgi:hypothetical protein
MAPRKSPGFWTQVINAVGTPLGFYVLALLIVEATLSIVLVGAQLDASQRYSGFLWMIGAFAGVVLIVTAFTICSPKNLLYGKEEHAMPQTSPSALKDQIEDLIAQNIKPECLKSPPSE